MNDLAYTPPKGKDVPLPAMSNEDESGDPKPQYPSLRFNGHQAEKGKLTDCKFGEEFEITIRVRATSIGGNSWERGSEDKPAVEFEVLASDDPKMVEAHGEPDELEKERPKRKPKQREVGPDEDWKKEYKE